jgi:hypothetical protein
MDLLFFISSWLLVLYFNSFIIYMIYPIFLFLIYENLINMWMAFLIIIIIYIFVITYSKLLFLNF